MIAQRVAAVAVFAMFASAPLFAQDAAPAAPTAAPAPPAKPVKEKKVCRSEAVLGSNLPNVTCHTKGEWAAIDGQNRANVQNMRDAGGFTPH
ncbi:hypothetical protein HZF05_13450 [Sphingomonas sp. CGMCC 1.13654]|uniref:Uncharacterized protein n=1 Tax=Sphingomonas chungangi TaxID=2683589 RepID=A0A838L702_9SPHN|nr:hypothetical protein [Sphingomonas chungangi]MBA2935101.1 hypothetical protein [Sphingomonas chungangi]MVW54217.1 hypothetical protein [Sphingomonas chungangi]